MSHIRSRRLLAHSDGIEALQSAQPTLGHEQRGQAARRAPRRHAGFAAATAASVVALSIIAATAFGATGDLTQKAGTDGCISNNGTSGACVDGVALIEARSVTVSPDGTSAYVASDTSGAVTVFDRDTATGKLTQKAGADGCISDTGAGSCVDGVALGGARSVSVSPDGKSAYVASQASSAVAVFDRDTTTGKLTQKAGTDGCISNDGSSGDCVDGVALFGARSVSVSPDGTSAYVTSLFSDAVAIFDRDTSGTATHGNLTQKAGTDGCIVEDNTGGGLTTCTDGVALDGVASVTISPDGASAYVASQTGDAVAVFDRNTTTGKLTQKAGTDGCISNNGTSGACVDGVALNGAFSVTVSPDGVSAYVASETGDAVAVFDRNTTTGKLTQKAGTDGCISNNGTSGACVDGVALNGAFSVTVSPDGSSAYVASGASGAVAVFDRNTTTGKLTQKAGTDGCISNNGTSGACVDGVALNGAFSVTVSPDGVSAYVASQTGDAVAVFDRQPLPETTIDSEPSATTDDNTPTFTFSSDPSGSSFECQVDNGAWVECSSPFTTFALADGPHRFRTRATDTVGNTTTPASVEFTVDTSADTTRPDTALTSEPTDVVKTKRKKAKLKFGFEASEAGSSFECKLNKGSYKPCSSTHKVKVKAKRKAKKHTFRVRAVDPAGNIDFSPEKWSGKAKRKG